jgi:hypothetical protein
MQSWGADMQRHMAFDKKTNFESKCGESVHYNWVKMGAESGRLCRRFLLPFAPTLDKSLYQNPF